MSSRPSSFPLVKPGVARFRRTSEVLRLPPPVWLIDGIIPLGGVVGLYGPPGTYKTFLAMDMAMSVASGTPWQGREVKKGFVAYIAAEGGTGVSVRIAAWLNEHKTGEQDVDENIGWLLEAVPIYSDSESLEAVIKRLSDELDRMPYLIVIDTMARTFDGDENQQEDMGRFIGGVDRLRKEFGSTVLIVHHTRLDGQRERGNTAFRGAADTMLAVGVGDKHGDIRLTCTKQKDAEEFAELGFRAKVVPIRLPGYTEFTSSVVIAGENTGRDSRILKAIQAADAEGIAYKDLKSLMNEKDGDTGSKISPATLKRRLVSLVENGKILRKNGIYYYAARNSRLTEKSA